MSGSIPPLRPSKSALMARDFSMIGAEPVEVVLPTGSRDAGGAARRRVWLEPLTGRDEEWLSNTGRVSSLPACQSLLPLVIQTAP